MKTQKILLVVKTWLVYFRRTALLLLPVLFVFNNDSFGQRARSKKKVQILAPADQRPKLRIGSTDLILPQWLTLNKDSVKTGYYLLQLDSNIVGPDPFRTYRDGENIPFIIATKDEKNIDRNVFTGILSVKNSIVIFTLNDSVVLNYKPWVVQPGSQIIYAASGIIISDLLLKRDSGSMAINSQQPTAGSPIDLAIENTNINDLLAMMGNDSASFSGLVNAKLLVSDFGKNLPSITGAATVGTFSFMNQTIGKLQINAQKTDQDKVHTTLDLLSADSQAILTGNYYLNNGTKQLDGSLEIKQLPARLFPFLPTAMLTNASGNINGSITFGGTFKSPELKGVLNIDSTTFMSPQSASPYSIHQQKIFIDYPSVSFNQFTIKDSLQNGVVIDGKMILQKSGAHKLDLKINAKDFTIIGAPKAIKNQLYGYAAANAAITITGDSKLPKLKGEIYLNEKTALTIVLPEKNTDKDASNSLVRFIDADTFALMTAPISRQSITLQADTLKLNHDVAIVLDPHASLTFIIDPSTGDELLVNGKAHLKAGIDTAGGVVISGVYTLDSGYYGMNYQYLNKRFNVQPGSSITFNGSPTNASLNITGVYIANTSPMDLLGNEVGVVDRRLLKSFNQQIPFEVILKLKGSVQEPQIGFDIQLPQRKMLNNDLAYTIENKLVQLKEDVPATNKQVFALLMLERFVGEQSADFFKGNANASGFSVNSTISVSQFLSAALDEIASDLFKGINTDLKLNSYKDFMVNDGAHKTDLGVELSKNFLDDRLSITVGRTYGIESQDGSAKAAQQKGSRFLPDVTVNYKLSKDGRYKLRSYKKDPFEVILDGYVVETGLAFIVTMDLETYKALFVNKNNKTSQ